ncbi:branched-chain amino acid transport system / permease component family protein [Burkholderia cenocepacia]|uniref:Branched-chain amino acid transport system / permease component family protein n=1 Tax=Burkholderia cenocepacia TaxID=95486 RepID=A0AAN0RNC5_9BURK|nr:branched-chain amino acid transport system / permease component family protein [Burkholderia cenocepacia]
MSDPVIVPPESRSTASASRKSVRMPSLGEFGWIWVGLVLLIGVSLVVVPGTMTRGSILAMLPFAGILAIVATGETLVIQQRGLDMSAIGMVSLAGVVMARTGLAHDSLLLAVAVAVAVCALVGFVNGVLISRLAIMPLVATLASNALLVGAVRSLTDNAPVNVPVLMQAISHAQLIGLPANIWIAFAFVVTAWIMTRKTAIGRRFVAVGVNPRAAEAAGVRVLWYQIGAYVASAVCFGAAGMLLAGFIGSASATSGNDYLLPAIAAVVVGGTPFTGGKGSVIASAAAALFMAQLGQLVLALGAGDSIQLLVQASAILLATLIRHLPQVLHSLRRFKK